MATNTIIPVGNSVQGDITSCEVDVVRTSVDRTSVLSFQQRETFQSYDVCTKQIVDEYDVPTLTGFGFTSVFIGIVFLFVLFITVIVSFSSSPY